MRVGELLFLECGHIRLQFREDVVDVFPRDLFHRLNIMLCWLVTQVLYFASICIARALRVRGIVFAPSLG